MLWIYILKCDNDIYYVGQTGRLYRRFWEHINGQGSINTTKNRVEKIVAIYKVNNLNNFIEYNNKILNNSVDNKEVFCRLKFFNDKVSKNKPENAENNIADRLIIHYNKCSKVRGGKYISDCCHYTIPNNKNILELPICYCGIPCDIKKNNKNNFLYFRCPKNNMWDELKEQFGIPSWDKPCKFYREYIKDIEYRVENKKRIKNRQQTFGFLINNSEWLINIPIDNDYECGSCVSCDNYVWCDNKGEFKDNGIQYPYNKDETKNRRLLCKNCFIENNEELSKKYALFNSGVCLI